MLSFKDIMQKLKKLYSKNSSFFNMASGRAFPLKISLKAPSSSEIAANFNRVFAEVNELNSSPLKPFLIYAKRTIKGYGTQNVPSHCEFANRRDFEEFLIINDKELHRSWLMHLKSLNALSHSDKRYELSDLLCSVQQQESDIKAFSIESDLYTVIADDDAAIGKTQFQDGLNNHESNGTQASQKKYIKLSRADASYMAKVLQITSVPSSFRAYDEVVARLIKPLYPCLKQKQYDLRTRGLTTFIVKNACNIAHEPKLYLMAMQFVDYMIVEQSHLPLYLRSVSLPYMHSKFVEQNYPLISNLLDHCSEFTTEHNCFLEKRVSDLLKILHNISRSEPSCYQYENQWHFLLTIDVFKNSKTRQELRKAASDIVHHQNKDGLSAFIERLGFQDKDDSIRLRSLDPNLSVLEGSDDFGHDLSLTIGFLNKKACNFRQAIIVENEACYLNLPLLKDTLAIFGAGYRAVLNAYVSHFHDRDIIYWGDIDTHGFGCLNKFRESYNKVEKYEAVLAEAIKQFVAHNNLDLNADKHIESTFVALNDKQEMTFAPALSNEDPEYLSHWFKISSYDELLSKLCQILNGLNKLLSQDRIEHENDGCIVNQVIESLVNSSDVLTAGKAQDKIISLMMDSDTLKDFATALVIEQNTASQSLTNDLSPIERETFNALSDKAFVKKLLDESDLVERAIVDSYSLESLLGSSKNELSIRLEQEVIPYEYVLNKLSERFELINPDSSLD